MQLQLLYSAFARFLFCGERSVLWALAIYASFSNPLFGFIVRGLMFRQAMLHIVWQSNLTPAVPSLSVYRRLYAKNLRRPRTPLAWMKRFFASQTDSARR